MKLPSTKTLAQIALIESVVITLPDKNKMLEFVCRGLLDTPGVSRVGFCIHENNIELKSLPNNNDVPAHKFLIKLKDLIFAELVFDISNASLFLPYPPFIKNLTSMLAVIFEERRLKALNYRHIQALQRSKVLEKVAFGSSLGEVLTEIIVNYEILSPDTLCSVLLVDEAGMHLHHGTSSNLPDFYKETVDNMDVDFTVDPRGVAISTGKRVIKKSLDSHQNQSDYINVTEKSGLLACWSEPIISSTSHIMGTFTVYYCKSREPSLSDLSFIQDSARLAGIAIERNNAEHYENEFIKKVRHCVLENISVIGFGTETLAAKLFMSRSTIQRKIECESGLTAAYFIRRIRLEKAHYYVQSKTHRTLAETAYAVGFSHAGHFSKLYKKYCTEKGYVL